MMPIPIVEKFAQYPCSGDMPVVHLIRYRKWLFANIPIATAFLITS